VTVDSSDRRRAGGYLSRQGPHIAVGAVRSGDELLAPPQPRPRLLRARQGPPRRQDRLDVCRPPAGPPLLARPSQRRPEQVYAIPTRNSQTWSLLSVNAVGNAHSNIRVTRGQLLPPACPLALVLDGLQTLTRPLSHPRTRSRLLSPTTSRSSSTQVTQGAPTTPPTGQPTACADPRVGQGRSSSLRCGRSTLTSALGSAPAATRPRRRRSHTGNAGYERCRAVRWRARRRCNRQYRPTYRRTHGT
jgi:hypothetical protein